MDSPAPATPRPAAAVILVRAKSPNGEVEVYLQRRHHKASFMSSAYVFPGGAADADEHDLRITAARELFEEAGVLLTQQSVTPAIRTRWRQTMQAGERRLSQLLAENGVILDSSALRYYAHWITPSIEKKRFAAQFYLAVLPAGQEPSVDHHEAVDELWVTPDQALARSAELRLPPPQIRTLLDMREDARHGINSLLSSASERARYAHALLPRMAPLGARTTLLLPWDPDYEHAGVGEFLPLPDGHPLACGPSRFVLEDQSWKHISAPDSPTVA